MKEEDLKQIFIDSIKIKILKSYAIVEFKSEADALNAINEKNGIALYDNDAKLHVEFYKEKK
jgi:hypothetical protein